MDATATRSRILETAASVFAARGFAATGIRAISSRARVNLAAVNYHFGGKERLYQETLRHVRARAYDRYPATLGLPADAPPEAQLQAFIRSFLLRTCGDEQGREFGTLVMREMVEPTSGLDLMVEESMRPLFDQLVGIVGALLGDAADQELVRSCSRGVISQCLFHLFSRSLACRMAARPGANAAEALDKAAGQILHFSLSAVREIARRNGPSRQVGPTDPGGARRAVATRRRRPSTHDTTPGEAAAARRSEAERGRLRITEMGSTGAAR